LSSAHVSNERDPLARSLRLNGQNTSVRHERVFWAVLDRTADEQRRSTASLISAMHGQVLERRGPQFHLGAALRLPCPCAAAATGGQVRRADSSTTLSKSTTLSERQVVQEYHHRASTVAAPTGCPWQGMRPTLLARRR
jgi:predicted DNA-binding ribbon-helix-helix protein